jgi:nitric oxide reductase subunit C
MGKILIVLGLFSTYIFYSVLVYTKGTGTSIQLAENDAEARMGKRLFQQKNCIACHQLYGLGGYIGPELTTAWSDKDRGELYIRAFLQAGGRTMPNFHFKTEEVDAIVKYLRYVDSTATTYK